MKELISSTFSEVKEEDYIIHKEFKEQNVSISFEKQVFKHCLFENVNWDSGIYRVEFEDCEFKNCDLSNLDFSNISIQDCSFKDCKMIGSNFSESVLKKVTFQDCILKYSNFFVIF